jgi:hypothetical protein
MRTRRELITLPGGAAAWPLPRRPSKRKDESDG